MPSHHPDISGKVALITGGARRIGAQIATTLHSAGMNICLHYRSSSQEAEALKCKLENQRTNSVHLVQADLHDIDNLPALPAQTVAHYGRLDLLVNNASTYYPTPVGEITQSDWDNLLGSNLQAPLFLSQAAAPMLHETSGCIINLIDIHAERPMKNHTVYSIAKSGLLALTRSLARELAPGVRVNGIAPGAILWPEADDNPEEQQNIVSKIALQRPGEPRDIANAVLFLFRDAPYITGHMLPVDGGRLLNI